MYGWRGRAMAALRLLPPNALWGPAQALRAKAVQAGQQVKKAMAEVQQYVAKIDRMRIVMEIAEGNVPFVRPGTAITRAIGTLGAQPIPGAITRTADALNPRTRTMRATGGMGKRELARDRCRGKHGKIPMYIGIHATLDRTPR